MTGSEEPLLGPRSEPEAQEVVRAVPLVCMSPAQAAGAARVVGQSAAVVALRQGSAVVLEDVASAVGIGAVATGLDRRAPAATVWYQRQPDGADAAGIVLTARGKPVAAHGWPAQASDIEDPEVASVLAVTLGVADEQAALRAVLRCGGSPLESLAEAVDVLHLDARVLDLLAWGAPEGALHVAPERGRGRFRRALKASRLVPRDGVPRALRLVWVLPALVAAWFLVRVAVAITRGDGGDVMGYAVLFAVAAANAALSWRRFGREREL